MSLRLFGNILVGGILMTLVYTFTGWLTSILLPFLGEFNIIGIAIAPILHEQAGKKVLQKKEAFHSPQFLVSFPQKEV